MSGPSYLRVYFKDMASDDFPIELEDAIKSIMIDHVQSGTDYVYSYRTHDGAVATFRASQVIGLRTFTPESRETVERVQAAIDDEIKLVRHDLGIFDQNDYR